MRIILINLLQAKQIFQQTQSIGRFFIKTVLNILFNLLIKYLLCHNWKSFPADKFTKNMIGI